MKLIEIVANIICNTLSDPDVPGRARLRKSAFTRNCGKLPFWTMMELLLKNVKLSISSMPDDFFSVLRKEMGGSISQTVRCSQQAFRKARAGISHTIFQECFENVLDFLCSRESPDHHHRPGGIWGDPAGCNRRLKNPFAKQEGPPPKIRQYWERRRLIAILNAVDREDPAGKRDYAVLLLTIQSGLRAGDCSRPFNRFLRRNKKGTAVCLKALSDSMVREGEQLRRFQECYASGVPEEYGFNPEDGLPVSPQSMDVRGAIQAPRP